MSNRKVANGSTRTTAPENVAAMYSLTPTATTLEFPFSGEYVMQPSGNYVAVPDNPTAAASKSEEWTLPDLDPRDTETQYILPRVHPRVLSCVISICNTGYSLSVCEDCGTEVKEDEWVGFLEDSIHQKEWGLPWIEWVHSDPTRGKCEGMIARLQGMALNYGYTHCELRQIMDRDRTEYLPLYSGPIPSMKSSA
jgi:hypothetical protein